MKRGDSGTFRNWLSRWHLACSTCVILLATAGCGPTPVREGPWVIDLLVSPTPATVGEARLLVTVADSSGAPVEADLVWVQGTLDDTTAVSRDATREDPGRYGVDDFPFPRPGDWRLIVRVESGGVTGRRSFPVHAVPSG